MCGTGRGWGLLDGVISILTVCLVPRTVKTSGRVCVGRPWCRTWTLPRTSQTRPSKQQSSTKQGAGAQPWREWTNGCPGVHYKRADKERSFGDTFGHMDSEVSPGGDVRPTEVLPRGDFWSKSAFIWAWPRLQSGKPSSRGRLRFITDSYLISSSRQLNERTKKYIGVAGVVRGCGRGWTPEFRRLLFGTAPV